MDKQKYKIIKENYGGYASWAIWNHNDLADLSVIDKEIENLNPNIIMLGLNISASLDKAWQNFHAGKHDRKLMKAFNEGEYRGAYMTDFIKGVAEPKSKLVMEHLQEPKLSKYVESFETELEIIGSDNPTIIVFGADKSQLALTIKKLFSEKYIVKNIPHYSSWGTDQEWLDKVRLILNK